MTKVYFVSDDERFLFRSVIEARSYAFAYLLKYPDAENVEIWPKESWDDDNGGWGVETYTQRNVKNLSPQTKAKLKRKWAKFFSN